MRRGKDPAAGGTAAGVGIIAEANGPFLFPSRDGKGHMRDLKSSWRTLCKAAGLEGVRLHDLRHSFASVAVSRGATLPLIGALLGHSNPTTTARYSHLYDDPQRAVAESVAAIITAFVRVRPALGVELGRARSRNRPQDRNKAARMSGNTVGGGYRTTSANLMRAFDKLPPEVRAALANAVDHWAKASHRARKTGRGRQ